MNFTYSNCRSCHCNKKGDAGLWGSPPNRIPANLLPHYPPPNFQILFPPKYQEEITLRSAFENFLSNPFYAHELPQALLRGPIGNTRLRLTQTPYMGNSTEPVLLGTEHLTRHTWTARVQIRRPLLIPTPSLRPRVSGSLDPMGFEKLVSSTPVDRSPDHSRGGGAQSTQTSPKVPPTETAGTRPVTWGASRPQAPAPALLSSASRPSSAGVPQPGPPGSQTKPSRPCPPGPRTGGRRPGAPSRAPGGPGLMRASHSPESPAGTGGQKQRGRVSEKKPSVRQRAPLASASCSRSVFSNPLVLTRPRLLPPPGNQGPSPAAPRSRDRDPQPRAAREAGAGAVGPAHGRMGGPLRKPPSLLEAEE